MLMVFKKKQQRKQYNSVMKIQVINKTNKPMSWNWLQHISLINATETQLQIFDGYHIRHELLQFHSVSTHLMFFLMYKPIVNKALLTEREKNHQSVFPFFFSSAPYFFSNRDTSDTRSLALLSNVSLSILSERVSRF